ncbi:MAG: hypothetical protein KA053_02540 [Lentimicrobiaceae bacterium]|nr:hypothetical protein [Lentimicrobiaceae bacterium]
MLWTPPPDFRPYWQEEYKVSAFDVDPLARLRLTHLFNYLQEAAYQHATHLGFGPFDVARQNLSWVLSAIRLDIHFLPLWNEVIRLETWPKPAHRIFYSRDFMLSKDGQAFGEATSHWLLIDRDSRKPKYLKELTEALAYIPVRDAIQELPIGPDLPEREPEVIGHDVSFFDLDQNGHVNTSRYVEWSLSPLPDPWKFFGSAFRFNIQFINEIRAGEHLSVAHWHEEGEFQVRGWNTSRDLPAWVASIHHI